MRQLSLFDLSPVEVEEEEEPVRVYPAGTLLSEARAATLAAIDKGTTCPCCDQYVRLYKRKLNANMAEFLCSLVRNYQVKHLIADYDEDVWIHFKECKFTGLDYAYLALWGLMETKANLDPAKKGSGLWRPTQKGIDFARGKVSVPSHVHIYNNVVMGWSDTTVSIREAFDRYFDYAELMR